ncbi:unnamed protein product [Mortierella alpina]
MEGTQLFRLSGRQNIEEIPFSHVGGHNVVLWENIDLVFPNVKYFKSGSALADAVRDSNGASDVHGTRIDPLRTKHYPGLILDVVEHTAVPQAHMTTSTLFPTLGSDFQVQFQEADANMGHGMEPLQFHSID